MIGILGKKLGMTQIFINDGKICPVTVVEAGPCCVIQVKTLKNDGYESVKIGFIEIEEKKLNKPLAGIYKRAGVKTYRILKEFPMSGLKVGEFLTVEKFTKGDKVSVTGVSKGKGFQGVVKRHGFAGGPKSHGSHFHRRPGSGGNCVEPGRVVKGRKLPGHMGARRKTVRGLKVILVDAERNLLVVKGSTPGTRGTVLELGKRHG